MNHTSYIILRHPTFLQHAIWQYCISMCLLPVYWHPEKFHRTTVDRETSLCDTTGDLVERKRWALKKLPGRAASLSWFVVRIQQTLALAAFEWIILYRVTTYVTAIYSCIISLLFLAFSPIRIDFKMAHRSFLRVWDGQRKGGYLHGPRPAEVPRVRRAWQDFSLHQFFLLLALIGLIHIFNSKCHIFNSKCCMCISCVHYDFPTPLSAMMSCLPQTAPETLRRYDLSTKWPMVIPCSSNGALQWS